MMSLLTKLLIGIPTANLIACRDSSTLQDQSPASYEAWDCAPAQKVLCAKLTLLLIIVVKEHRIAQSKRETDLFVGGGEQD